MLKNPRDWLYCDICFIVMAWKQTCNISEVWSCRHHPEYLAQKLNKYQLNLHFQPLSAVDP